MNKNAVTACTCVFVCVSTKEEQCVCVCVSEADDRGERGRVAERLAESGDGGGGSESNRMRMERKYEAQECREPERAPLLPPPTCTAIIPSSN